MRRSLPHAIRFSLKSTQQDKLDRQSPVFMLVSVMAELLGYVRKRSKTKDSSCAEKVTIICARPCGSPKIQTSAQSCKRSGERQMPE
jgi:hypothetical protein